MFGADFCSRLKLSVSWFVKGWKIKAEEKTSTGQDFLQKSSEESLYTKMQLTSLLPSSQCSDIQQFGTHYESSILSVSVSTHS